MNTFEIITSQRPLVKIVADIKQTLRFDFSQSLLQRLRNDCLAFFNAEIFPDDFIESCIKEADRLVAELGNQLSTYAKLWPKPRPLIQKQKLLTAVVEKISQAFFKVYQIKNATNVIIDFSGDDPNLDAVFMINEAGDMVIKVNFALLIDKDLASVAGIIAHELIHCKHMNDFTELSSVNEELLEKVIADNLIPVLAAINNINGIYIPFEENAEMHEQQISEAEAKLTQERIKQALRGERQEIGLRGM